jgi:hypothetical protein
MARNRDFQSGRRLCPLPGGGKADLNGRHWARCCLAGLGPRADRQLLVSDLSERTFALARALS